MMVVIVVVVMVGHRRGAAKAEGENGHQCKQQRFQFCVHKLNVSQKIRRILVHLIHLN